MFDLNEQEDYSEKDPNFKNASWRDKKENTSAFGLEVILFIYKVFGKKAAYLTISIVVFCFWMFAPKARRISRSYLNRIQNFANAHGKNLPKLSTYLHIRSFAISIFEKMLSWKGVLSDASFTSPNHDYERMLECARLPEGAILIGSHVGNMEMLRGINANSNIKNVCILMLTENSQRFMNYLKSLNPESAKYLIEVNNISPETAFIIDDRLKKGEWLSLMGDRVLSSDSRAVEVDFLGSKARFPMGPWLLASMFKVPLYVVHGVSHKGSCQIHFQNFGVVKVSRKDRTQDIKNYVQEYAHILEEILCENPYEWFNFYGFWQDKTTSSN